MKKIVIILFMALAFLSSAYGFPDAHGRTLLTGTVTAQINPNGGTAATYLYSVLYYNNRGRLIQTKGNSPLSGGLEKQYTAYTFTGQPAQERHIHSATGKTTQTEDYTYTYDHADRLTQITHKLNSLPTTTIAENTYDDQGRLSTNKKGDNSSLNATYSYNVRSWVKSITAGWFNQYLYYNESHEGSTKCYNGNISAMHWSVLSEWPGRSYVFYYNGLSWMTAADYLDGSSANGNFRELYTYDKQGNITALQRYGKTGSSSYGPVDLLTLTYSGNRLLKVDDTVANIALPGSGDFKNYSSVTQEYFYNANGAMTKDMNKGISNIQYNLLNLPGMIDIKSPVGEARNEYTYSASGQKLKMVQKWNPNYSTNPTIGSSVSISSLTMKKTTEYVGNRIYENGTLKRTLITGGYIENGAYHYNLTDHLGNVRKVVKGGSSMQKNHYYPSGTLFAESTYPDSQPYKFGGKELDRMHGLNLYDFSARFYESALMRFLTVDPLAEKYYSISPYAYCMNNPMKFVDPDGRDPRIYVERKGFGHSFVTTGSGENTTVYTYGRYGELGKNKSSARSTSPTGEGVLIKLTGEEAASFIQKQLSENGAKVYEFVGGSDELVSGHFDNLLESSDKTPSAGKYVGSENAKVIDKYNLFDNNCVTKSVEGVQKGVTENINLKGVKGPDALGDRLNVKSQKNENGVRVVSLEEIKIELNLE